MLRALIGPRVARVFGVANKRLKKKMTRKVLAEAARGDRPSDEFARRVVRLEVACPTCRRFTLARTYVPRLGSMNGMVDCSRCEYRDQFANAMAIVMGEVDPIPAALTVPKTDARAIVRPPTILHELVAHAAVLLRVVVRAWRNATAPEPRRLPRRWARAHSAVT